MSLQDTLKIRKLINYSLYLKDGQKYKRPEGFFIPVPPQLIRKVDQSPNFIPRSGTLPSRPITKRSPKAQEMLRPRANSLKRYTSVNSSLRTNHSADPMTLEQHELGISDGYFEDDPEVLKINLDHMARVMAISRLKLQQYVGGLRENLRNVQNPKVAQYLNGLEELCAFMAPREERMRVPMVNRANQNHSTGQLFQYMSPPVERAYAADEVENGGFPVTPRSGDLTSTPKTGRKVGIGNGNLGGNNNYGKAMNAQEVKTEFVRRAIKEGEEGKRGSCDSSREVEVELENGDKSGEGGKGMNGENGKGEEILEENATESQVMITGSFLNDLSGRERSRNNSSFQVYQGKKVAQKGIGNKKEVELMEIVNGKREGFGDGDEWEINGEMIPKEKHKFVPSRDPQMERRDSM